MEPVRGRSQNIRATDGRSRRRPRFRETFVADTIVGCVPNRRTARKGTGRFAGQRQLIDAGLDLTLLLPSAPGS